MHRTHADITLGRRLRTRRLGDLAVHEVTYPGGWSVAPHAHAHANLTFVIRGTIEESVRDEAMALRACHAVVKPAGVVHRDRCGPDGAATIVVEFPGETFPSSEPGGRDPSRYATLWGPEVARSLLRMSSLVRAARPDAPEDATEVVLETLALVPDESERVRGGPAWLPRARGLLHDGFAAPLRVQDLARELDLHPVYLARAFRRASGCSVTSYRRRLQVSDAARRLLGTDESLAEVALRSGFADQSHLSRTFRAAIGVAPGAFRERMRG
jgi:AraC family transcriptional regulator